MISRPFLSLFLVAGLLAGCRVANNDYSQQQRINPRYYEDWSCSELRNELGYVVGRLGQRHHQIRTRSGEDVLLSAAGVAIFPPMLGFVSLIQTSDDQDFIMLSKHAEAISSVAREKQCGGVPEIEIREKNS